MPGLAMAGLDGRAALFAVAIAALAGIVVGTYPVTMLVRYRGVPSSEERSVGGGRGTQNVRSGFVVAQFALALPLLTATGLLLASFARLQRIDPGFDPRYVLTAQVSLPAGQYGSDTLVAAYWSRALAHVREVPGVAGVGLGSSLPPDDFGSSNDNFNLVDRPTAPGAPEPNAAWPSVDAGYFTTLEVPRLDGRLFAPTDTGAAPVVVVTRSWAEKHYPGESPLGKTLIRGGCTQCPLTTIVGVVDDVRYAGLTGPLDGMHSPVSEGWPRTLYLFVRATRSPVQLTTPIREALRSVDASVPLDDIATMEDRLYAVIAQPRQWATLLGGFAAVALGLAAVGVFGMLSYVVGTRRREIGVRMALGAGRPKVVGMIVGSGLTYALVGALLGLLISLLGAPLLANVLHDVSVVDPRALAGATGALLAVALVACWLPALRAATIDPLEAIRHE
jgi:putative ABC transport system permease protein